MAEKICSYGDCQHFNISTAKHCVRCGREILEDTEAQAAQIRECSNCGHRNSWLATFCAKCGRGLSSEVENLRRCAIHDQGTQLDILNLLSLYDLHISNERLKGCMEERLRRFGIKINKGSTSYLRLAVMPPVVMPREESLFNPKREVLLITAVLEFHDLLSRGNSDELIYGITWSRDLSWVIDKTDEEFEDLLMSSVEEDLAEKFGVAVGMASGRNRPYRGTVDEAEAEGRICGPGFSLENIARAQPLERDREEKEPPS